MSLIFGVFVLEVVFMVKFSQLESFVAVVENGSINKAAEKLYMTQPSLSRILKSLEDEMGKQLLNRNSQGVEPTREGKLFYTYAQSILSELKVLDQLKTMDMDEISTELNVSIYSFFIQNQLFVDLYDEILSHELIFNVLEGTLEQLVENVISGQSELGIAVVNDVEFPSVKSVATARNLDVEILDVGPACVHIGKHHKLYNRDKVYMKDLLDSRYLHIPLDTFSRSRLDINIDGILLKDFKRTVIVNNYHLIKTLLQNNHCFLFGNYWQSQELSNASIKTFPIENCDIQMYLIKITNKSKSQLSNQAIDFLDKLKKHYIPANH